MLRRKLLPDGTLGPLEDVFGELTPEQKMELLESESAQMAYDSMMKDIQLEEQGAKISEQAAKISEIENVQAGIIYEIMMGGIQ